MFFGVCGLPHLRVGCAQDFRLDLRTVQSLSLWAHAHCFVLPSLYISHTLPVSLLHPPLPVHLTTSCTREEGCRTISSIALYVPLFLEEGLAYWFFFFMCREVDFAASVTDKCVVVQLHHNTT